MKKIVEVTDEGLEGLLGETVIIMCVNYFYTGKLAGVNSSCVKLDEPSIIYESGPWSERGWKDAQKLPNSHYIQITSIESFGVSND